jgi:flagellar motility protein MotE (MotC chaperone)
MSSGAQCAPFLSQMVPDAAALILAELEYDYAAAVLAVF